MTLRLLLLLFLSLSSLFTTAQDTAFIRKEIAVLSAKGMAGRGYVSRGAEKAGRYIAGKFQDMGLQPLAAQYEQAFTFSVNTFPSRIVLRIGDHYLKPGADFLIHPASRQIVAENKKIKVTDFGHLKPEDTAKQWAKIYKQLSRKNRLHLLRNTDSLLRIMNWGNNLDEVTARLPEGGFLIPRSGKPMWTVAQHSDPSSVFFVYHEEAVNQKRPKATLYADQKLDSSYVGKNIIGMIPGTAVPDSFLVLTAHYDHLGKMGAGAIFPGASDNASGTAMLLSLAQHYAQFPQRYSIVFIAFAGEEPGLLGSRFFTENPLIDLKKIRFLINLDIMGDATNGITVVNGSVFKEEMRLLEQLNRELDQIVAPPMAPPVWADSFLQSDPDFSTVNDINDPLPESEAYTVVPIPAEEQALSWRNAWKPLPSVLERAAAANSDHYYFYLKGVPCFFIYSNGGPGYYHDIWDKADTLSLARIEDVQALIERFIHALQ